MVHHDGTTAHWLGYATLRLAGDDVIVYCDPGRYGVLDGMEPGDGDVICVTHDHHYDTFEALETDPEAFAADAASRGVPVVLD